MSIGFVGLAETLIALYGHHHGEGKEYWDKGYAIIKHMRDYTDKISNEMKLNFGLLATPKKLGTYIEIYWLKVGELTNVRCGSSNFC